MAENNLTQLKAQLDVAYKAMDFGLIASLAGQIRKLEHAEAQAKLEKAQEALLELTSQIRKDIADKNSELSKAIKPHYARAKELIGVENACFMIYIDQKELDVKIVKYVKKAKSSSNGPSNGITNGYPKTEELLKTHGEIKLIVRWDKAEHVGTFAELVEAAKNAVDKNNASFNVRTAIVKHIEANKVTS